MQIKIYSSQYYRSLLFALQLVGISVISSKHFLWLWLRCHILCSNGSDAADLLCSLVISSRKTKKQVPSSAPCSDLECRCASDRGSGTESAPPRMTRLYEMPSRFFFRLLLGFGFEKVSSSNSFRSPGELMQFGACLFIERSWNCVLCCSEWAGRNSSPT